MPSLRCAIGCSRSGMVGLRARPTSRRAGSAPAVPCSFVRDPGDTREASGAPACAGPAPRTSRLSSLLVIGTSGTADIRSLRPMRLGPLSLAIAVGGLVASAGAVRLGWLTDPWWQVVVTGFQAATIGGLADWFAV